MNKVHDCDSVIGGQRIIFLSTALLNLINNYLSHNYNTGSRSGLACYCTDTIVAEYLQM